MTGQKNENIARDWYSSGCAARQEKTFGRPSRSLALQLIRIDFWPPFDWFNGDSIQLNDDATHGYWLTDVIISNRINHWISWPRHMKSLSSPFIDIAPAADICTPISDRIQNWKSDYLFLWFYTVGNFHPSQHRSLSNWKQNETKFTGSKD